MRRKKNNGVSYAIDIQKQEKLWEFKIDNGIHSSPVINDGVVNFGSEDGYFYALY